MRNMKIFAALNPKNYFCIVQFRRHIICRYQNCGSMAFLRVGQFTVNEILVSLIAETFFNNTVMRQPDACGYPRYSEHCQPIRFRSKTSAQKHTYIFIHWWSLKLLYLQLVLALLPRATTWGCGGIFSYRQRRRRRRRR